MKHLLLILLVLFSLPILLHVYNPSMQLGGFGLLLGVIGMTVSPVILLSPYCCTSKVVGKRSKN